MKVGIVGLPNAGKSTLFNALTKGGAQTGNYPFTTIEPNVAIAQVPDERLEQVAQTVRSSELVPATISFHDIAGLVGGPRRERGLATSFSPRSARPTRSATSSAATPITGVPHPEGRVDPLADIETIETELILADLEQVERRLERVGKQAKSGDDRAAARRARWLEADARRSATGGPARSVPPPDAAPEALASLRPLTSKPVLLRRQRGRGDQTSCRRDRRRTPRRPVPARSHLRAPGVRARPSSTRRGGRDARGARRREAPA